MHKLINYICDELESLERKVDKGGLSMSELQYIDTLAHAGKNLKKLSESDDGYSRGYYYDDGYSNRRGRAMNGRFVSRDGSEMARKLREMMDDAPDSGTRSEIQRLADKMENM